MGRNSGTNLINSAVIHIFIICANFEFKICLSQQTQWIFGIFQRKNRDKLKENVEILYFSTNFIGKRTNCWSVADQQHQQFHEWEKKKRKINH